MNGSLFTAVFAGLLALSVPLFVLIGAMTALGDVIWGDAGGFFEVTLMESVRELTDKPPLLAIPFFVLSGAVMSRGAIATRLVGVARAVFGGLPGGLGIATVVACMFFAAISGSSPVTVITIGGVMYPALIAAGYPERFALGLVTSAGTLGILIPPSIPMIVYAIFASGDHVIQVEELFLAGLGPGLLIGALLSLFCLIAGLRKGERFTMPDFGAVRVSIIEGFWSLMLPVLILGGIYSGLFTATEAAAVSVVYSLVVELFIHRQLKLEDVPGVVAESAVLMGSLLVIFAMAVGLNALLADLAIPDRAAEWLTSQSLTPFTFLLVLNGFLLLVGCVMDIMSAIMILVPLLAPMAALCGVDPVHLGIVFIVNLELGYLTPPMGLNLFVSSSIFEKPLGRVIASVVPFTGILLVAVLIVTYVPTVALGPVRLLDGKPVAVAFPEGDICRTAGEPAADEPEGDEPEADEAKGLGDLMNSDAYKAAMGDDADDDGDDDEDDQADAAPQGKSVGDLMNSAAYKSAFDDDDDSKADDNKADAAPQPRETDAD
ncbi:MAG: TRAP transporter large permease [Myxococcales bacterium]|nr:TRAP transporter large permease [Myxococcales bacterium]